MLIRRRQLAAKIESEEGVLETFAAADGKTLAFDPKVSFDAEMFERNPVRPSISSLGQLSGKRPAGLTFRLEIRGSGTAATDPDWIKFLQACGFTASTLKTINIGAIAGGPFQHGETITGGISGAAGRVVFATVNGATKIYYVAVGTIEFQSGELLTGGTSAATATTSSTPSTVGREYKPITTGASSLSLGSYEDGILKQLKGCRGNAKFTFASGAPGLIDFDFKGVEAGIEDASFLSSISYESTKPPVLLDAALLLGSYAARIGNIDFDLGMVLAAREDINDDRGILSFALTGRKVAGSINPEMDLVANYDFHSKLFNNTEAVLDFTLGSVAGNMFRFYIPKLQKTNIDDADRDGLQIAQIPFQANGSVTGDDELTIVQL